MAPLLRFSVFSFLTFSLIYILDRPFGILPPIGRFLNPVSGIWHQPLDDNFDNHLSLPALKASAQVWFDDDRIPHVFAENDEDLYFIQGYLLARDRLWQMDFLSRLASARLSEVMGEKTVEFDRLFSKLSLLEAARDSLRMMNENPLTRLALESYTRGVNSYIEKLRPGDYPFEFKLLNYQPEPWTPLKSAVLVKFMAFQLAGHSMDVRLSRSLAKLSLQDFNELFPLEMPIQEPVIPRGTKWNFKGLSQELPPEQPYQADVDKITPLPTPNPSNGSNNWAVMGQKSTTGLPILSNDIHLDYSLPALWYTIQLHSPTQNAFGISLPGGPGVVLGFNQSLAWAVTNGGSDVMDWYELKFRNEEMKEYFYEGEWRPVIIEDREIKVRGKPPVKISLRRTHYGPIVYNDDETPLRSQYAKGLAMRWAVLEPSNEFFTFLSINRAKTMEECHHALADYQTPDQNFICADNQNNVGIFHSGLYPIRWKGQGRLVGDGANKLYEWKGWIPKEQIPQIINPERGFVSSANQAPTDETYPNYLGWPFEIPYRGARINEILSSKEKFSPEDIRKMQMDTTNILARRVLPHLLAALQGVSLTPRQVKIKNLLQQWNFQHDIKAQAATFFDSWWDELVTLMWAQHFPNRDTYMWPRPDFTEQLIIDHPQSKWFDLKNTPEIETLKEIAFLSFKSAEDITSHHDPEAMPKAWGEEQKTTFDHLAKIPGLGLPSFSVGGDYRTIFANDGHHGPVWKVVVALGKEGPQAWGIYPGGQSGNPTSRYYDNFVRDWSVGNLHPLVFLNAASDKDPRLQFLWSLAPVSESGGQK